MCQFIHIDIFLLFVYNKKTRSQVMNLFYSPFYPDKDKSFDENYEEYLVSTTKEFLEQRKKFKNNNLKILYKLDREELNSDDIVEVCLEVFDDFGKHKIKPSDIVIAFDNVFCKKTLSEKELDNLKKLDEAIKKLGATVGIFDHKDVFEYKDVKNADSYIKTVANRIKSNNFSPLEKLLDAYLLVAKNKYKNEDKRNESSSQSRAVYGILNSDKIVCTGYSELLKSIVKEIGDSNLKVFANLVGTECFDHIGFHQNNIVYIKDDKYKIDGFYYLDPTWDYIDKNSLKYFMTEIGQIKNIYEKIIDFDDAVKKYNKSETIVKAKPLNLRHKKFFHNYDYAECSSVSQNKISFGDELNFADINYDFADEILTRYLFSRQDFKDYVTLKQTLFDMKSIKEPFDAILEVNAKKVQEDITKLPILANSREMFKFLKKHSPHVDIGPIHDALHMVANTYQKDMSKDERSKYVYDILKFNIEESKAYFNKNGTAWTECEDLEK